MEENTEKNVFLGKEKISKLLLKFSVPCILSLLISLLYNIVDKIFIGNSALGTNGSAAVGVVFSIAIIAIAFAWCFGDGTAAYLSVCQGKKDTVNAHKAVGNALIASFSASIILIAIFIPLKTQLLSLFGADSNSISLAEEYFIILVAAFPAYMISNTMNSVIRADGSPAYAMFAMASGAVVNIIFDAIFITGCNMGMKGAAWATFIGQCISLILCSVYFVRSKTFRLTLKSFIPDPKVFWQAAKLGISTFITQMSIVAITLASLNVFKKYGDLSPYGSTNTIAAMTNETIVFTIVVNIVIGIILGAQPILGYNYGAKNYERVKRTFIDVLISSVIVGAIAMILAEACPQALFEIFGKGDEMYTLFATKIFRYFMGSIILTCVIKMSSIFLQSVGKPIKAAVISLVRDLICFIPLVLTLPIAYGIDGALWSAPCADIVAILVTIPLLIVFFKQFKKECILYNNESAPETARSETDG